MTSTFSIISATGIASGIFLAALVLAVPSAAEDDEPVINLNERITFGGLFYLTYEEGHDSSGDYSDFFVHRAYLTTKVEILPFLSGRITFDTTQDREGDGAGDMEVRLKYAFAKVDLGSHGRLVRDLNLEAGIVHRVWLDFEEHINMYRMRDPMFIERSGVFNSADFGVTLGGGLGELLGPEYRENVNSKYAHRYGSFAVGLYNGGGYHATEKNRNKVAEARMTVRPLPDSIPGLQVSGLAILGKGNQPGTNDEIPDWNTYDAMVSWESLLGAVTAQWVTGSGNQRGTWVEPNDPSESTDFDGWSVFAERQLGPHWRVYGGYDRFDRSTTLADLGFDRGYIGVAYDMGGGNMLVIDYDRRELDDPDRDTEDRAQVVFQLKF